MGIIILFPKSVSEIIVLFIKNQKEILLDLADITLQEQPKTI